MEEEQKKKKVNWFPGHMKSAMEDIEETKIKLADCILYVLDARAPFACMNPFVDKIVQYVNSNTNIESSFTSFKSSILPP